MPVGLVLGRLFLISPQLVKGLPKIKLLERHALAKLLQRIAKLFSHDHFKNDLWLVF